MSKISDQAYLKQQYQSAANLNDRIQLHVRFSTNLYNFHAWVFDQLKLAEGSQIIELGCGPGSLWQPNLVRIPVSWEITLTDFSPGMLEAARNRLAGTRLFTFEVADAQALPYTDARFDAVIANHMLYHVPDRAQALREIRRVVRPGGRFYATTNGETHLKELHNLVQEFDPKIHLWNRLTFTLEDGYAELATHFAHVHMYRQANALIVTEAAPLVAFAASMANAELSGERRAAFTQFVEQRIAADGAIHISKDSGLFEAY